MLGINQLVWPSGAFFYDFSFNIFKIRQIQKSQILLIKSEQFIADTQLRQIGKFLGDVTPLRSKTPSFLTSWYPKEAPWQLSSRDFGYRHFTEKCKSIYTVWGYSSPGVLRGLLYKTVERKINLKSFQHLLKYSHMTESFGQSLVRIYFIALKRFSNTDVIKGDAQVLKYLILCYTISKLKVLEFPCKILDTCVTR